MRDAARGDRCEAFRAELRSRPLAHVELPLVRHFHPGIRVEDECVGVAQYRRASEPPQECSGLCGLAAALQRVAEADDLVDGIALEVRGDGLERDRVPVDVGDQCGADARRLGGGTCHLCRTSLPRLPRPPFPHEPALAQAGGDHRDRDRRRVGSLGRELGAHGLSIAACALGDIGSRTIIAAG